jgi:type IV pilus assembly protein PilX
MSVRTMHSHALQRGMALISALLLLLVITILGVGMFRSFGLQQRIAGNTREKERAFHAASSALGFAEWWLSENGGVNAGTGVQCTGLANANAGGAQVCSNIIQTNVAAVPWPAAVTYTPQNMGAAGTGTYFQVPMFYISALDHQYINGITSNLYQVDAAGYGGSANTVAVVESTYSVSTTKTTQAPPPAGTSSLATKNIYLGGP